MRITNVMIANTMLGNITRNQLMVNRLMNQLATQQVIGTPSENPLIATRHLRFTNTINQLQQHQRNVDQATAWTEATEEAVRALNNVLNRIELLARQLDGAETLEDKQATMKEIEARLDEKRDIMNKTFAGRYLFSGLRTDQPPFFVRDMPDTQFVDITTHFSRENLETTLTLDRWGDYAWPNEPRAITIHRVNLPHRGDVLDPTFLDYPLDNIISGGTSTVLVNGVAAEVVPRNDDGTRDYLAMIAQPDVIFHDPHTGELISMDRYSFDFGAANRLEVVYNQTGFSRGDMNPKVFFQVTVGHGAASLDTFRDNFDNILGNDVANIDGWDDASPAARRRMLTDWINYHTPPGFIFDQSILAQFDFTDNVAINDFLTDTAALTGDNFPASFNMDEQDMEFEFGIHSRMPINVLAKNLTSAILISDLNGMVRDFNNFTLSSRHHILDSWNAANREAVEYLQDNWPGAFALPADFDDDDVWTPAERREFVQGELAAWIESSFPPPFVPNLPGVLEQVPDFADSAAVDAFFAGLDPISFAVRMPLDGTEGYRERAIMDTITTDRLNNFIGRTEKYSIAISIQETDLGARMQRLEMIGDRLRADELTFTDLSDSNIGTDMAEAATRLMTAEVALTASMQVGMHNLLTLTLLNFLR